MFKYVSLDVKNGGHCLSGNSLCLKHKHSDNYMTSVGFNNCLSSLILPLNFNKIKTIIAFGVNNSTKHLSSMPTLHWTSL